MTMSSWRCTPWAINSIILYKPKVAKSKYFNLSQLVSWDASQHMAYAPAMARNICLGVIHIATMRSVGAWA